MNNHMWRVEWDKLFYSEIDLLSTILIKTFHTPVKAQYVIRQQRSFNSPKCVINILMKRAYSCPFSVGQTPTA